MTESQPSRLPPGSGPTPQPRSPSIVAALYLSLALSLALAGCAGGGTAPLGSPGTGETDERVLHALMSKRLNLEFASLNALTFDLHRTETELARERRLQLDRIGDTARKLQRAAVDVQSMQSSTLSPSVSLSPDELQQFRTIAERLEHQAGTLATMAETGDLEPEDAREILGDINTTCDTCHGLYRTPVASLP